MIARGILTCWILHTESCFLTVFYESVILRKMPSEFLWESPDFQKSQVQKLLNQPATRFLCVEHFGLWCWTVKFAFGTRWEFHVFDYNMVNDIFTCHYIITVKLTSYSDFFEHRTNVSSASSTTLGLLFCAAFTYPSCVILLQDVRYTQSDRSYPNQHNKTLPFRESYTREKQKKFEPIRVFSLIKFVMHLSI